MGMIEVELVTISKMYLKEPAKLELLIAKMALIIDRQALALKAMQWHQESVTMAKDLDKELIRDILKFKQDLNPDSENPQETKTP